MRDRDGKPLLAHMPQIERLPEPKRIPNPVPLSVLAQIESDPAAPDHLWEAAALARLFGLRLAEICAARVDWIDWEQQALRLPAEFTKANRDEFQVANSEAMQLVAWLALFARERNSANEFLIVYTPNGGRKARPIKSLQGAWANALRRLGLEGRYRFHDIRATYVTQVAMVASSAVTQGLARHKSAATTSLYTRVADGAKRAAVLAMRSTSGLAAEEFGGQSPTLESHSRKKSAS
jgi:integrase